MRRLAAIDMYGTAGSPRRRWIILIEFMLGALIAPVLGVLAITACAPGTRVFGAWLLGVGLNYVPLALHALRLIRPGVLDAELSDVDTRAELRHYAVAQLWVAVPLAVVVLAVRQAIRRR